jgi:hypothetical protein
VPEQNANDSGQAPRGDVAHDPRESDRMRKVRIRLPRDLREILALAEELQSKLDIYSVRLLLNRVIQASLIIVFSLIGGGLSQTLWVKNSPDMAHFIYVLLGVICSIYVIAFEFSIRRYRRTVQRDRRALDSLVSLLRETEESIAKRNQWSSLQKAEFKIRLSRFEIGDSTKKT